MIDLGVFDGLNLDGGGSTALVQSSAGGSPDSDRQPKRQLGVALVGTRALVPATDLGRHSPIVAFRQTRRRTDRASPGDDAGRVRRPGAAGPTPGAGRWHRPPNHGEATPSDEPPDLGRLCCASVSCAAAAACD